MRAVSTPKPWFAASASPESLSRTRLKAGVAVMRESRSPASEAVRNCSAGVPSAVAGAPRPRRKHAKKGAHRAPFELFAFRLRRLRDRDGLAHVTHLEARKSSHRDVLAQLADLGRDELRDRDGLVLDEGLRQQANLFIELFHLAGNHLLCNVRGFPAGDRLSQEDVF